MRTISCLIIIIFLFLVPLSGEDHLKTLVKEFPVILVNFANQKNPIENTSKSISWSRTKEIPSALFQQLSIKKNQLYHKESPVEFLTSVANTADFEKGMILYRWDFQIESSCKFLIRNLSRPGALGFLNDTPIILLPNGLISPLGSGSQWVTLASGKNTLLLSANSQTPQQLKLFAETESEETLLELTKRFASKESVDIEWVENIFYPFISNIKGNISNHLIRLLQRQHANAPFPTNKSSAIFFLDKLLKNLSDYEAYTLEKFIYENYPEIYFQVFKTLNQNDRREYWSCFILSGYAPRTTFYEALVYDGQKELANQYFNQCIKIFNESLDGDIRNSAISTFYAQRFISYFRIGRIKEMFAIQEITEKETKPETNVTKIYKTIINYFKEGGNPETEENIVLTQSFHESLAFQLKEQIESYTGAPEQLSKIQKLFNGLPNQLVRVDGLTYSFDSYFHLLCNKHQPFFKDFKDYCYQKNKGVLEKETNMNAIESILEKYDGINDFPEYRIKLLETYYNRGNFVKALANAHLIAERYPDLLPEISSKLAFLEGISNLPENNKWLFPEILLNKMFKLKGESATIGQINKVKSNKQKQQNQIGALLHTAQLPPIHIQYWNHSWQRYHQPIEPLFTSRNVYFNGGSYLLNYSFDKNDIIHQIHSGLEFGNANETGPHAKRFVTSQASNQLYFFTNRANSGQKTIKCYDLNLNFLWDISDQREASTEEPLCAPIESQGKLFTFAYNKRETIKVIALSVFDSISGELLSRTPVSLMPAPIYDEVGSRRFGNWNTYTFDEHFAKEKGMVYGYTGTGVLLKINSHSGTIVWARGFAKSSIQNRERFYDALNFAAPGFIKIIDDVIITFMPDIQMLTGVHKMTGEIIWQTYFHKPQFFHHRSSAKAIYFSDANTKGVNFLSKLNPLDGSLTWQTPLNGIVINGEGDLLDEQLLIPTEKSFASFNEKTGELIKVTPLNIQPLKIRCGENASVIFTSHSAFICSHQGALSVERMVEQGITQKNNIFIEPDTKPEENISFENINLELAIKIPEVKFTTGNTHLLGTVFQKTSKPFHHIMRNGEHLTMFREGFVQKDGTYLPPQIIWYAQHSEYSIFENTLYFNESEKIKAVNLFTFEIEWEHSYQSPYSPTKNSQRKTPLVIASNQNFVAFQTEYQTIMILDIKTKKISNEFRSQIAIKLCLQDNYLIAMTRNDQITAYDIQQNCKELWSKSTTPYPRELFTKNGAVVLLQTGNPAHLFIYDIQNGDQIIKAAPQPGPRDKNRWIEENGLFLVFDSLYNIKTGAVLQKYKEGIPVKGGGFLGFFNRYGNQGEYLLNGQSYPFQIKGGRDQNYANICAIRKENKIAIMTRSTIEIFEIKNDHLAYVMDVRYQAGSGYTGTMELQPLDNSLLVIKNDEMYFLRNFDNYLELEKIQSCRVENKKNLNWPYSELVPETELQEKNWVSFRKQKSNRSIFYQIGSDEKYIYLKIRAVFQESNTTKSILNISTNDNRNASESIFITWNIIDWNNCQYSLNLKDSIESWKEIDIKGDTNLYIKIKQGAPLANIFKSTLPDFNIEIRLFTNEQIDGLYRIGGAYHQSKKIFPWLIYSNDESQNIKNYSLRAEIYEKEDNFYPQGEDLILWLKDRRKLVGTEKNILFLHQMLSKNTKSYCSVNILSALLFEEIHLLKANNPMLSELSEDYRKKLLELTQSIFKMAIEKGVAKDWAEFALSFWAIEIFPFKTYVTDSNGRFLALKAVSGVQLFSGNTILQKSDYFIDDNPFTLQITQPYLLYVFPSMIAGYPRGQEVNKIALQGVGTHKTGLGKMMVFFNQTLQEFCNREGVTSNSNYQFSLTNKGNIKVDNRFYYIHQQKYSCFTINNPDYLNTVLITVPPIKQPTPVLDNNLISKSILTSIEKLPSDSRHGQMMINDYFKLNTNADEMLAKSIYQKWLNSVRDHTANCYRALRHINQMNSKRTDNTKFILDIVKDAKLSPSAPRMFFLENQNRFSDKNARSVLGPFFTELETKPEASFKLKEEYRSKDSVYKFSPSLENKKGGDIYWASAITFKENERAFLFLQGSGVYANSIISIWWNGKCIADKEVLDKFDNDTFVQRITFNSGENILLIKISTSNNYNWSNELLIGVGDVFGAPINGVEFKPVH